MITLCAATHKLFLDVGCKRAEKVPDGYAGMIWIRSILRLEKRSKSYTVLSDDSDQKIVDAAKEYKSQAVK